MTRRRVCVVAACPTPFPRGTPIRVTRLTEATARAGHSVHLVTYGYGNGDLDSRVAVHRIPNIRGLESERPGPSVGKLLLLDPLLALKLRRILREHSFDIIHAHHFEALLVADAVAGGRLPIVYDAHTSLEVELPHFAKMIPESAKRSVGRFLDRVLPSRADFVVAVSEVLRDRLLSCGMPADRVEVVGNGVEVGTRPVLENPEPPPPDGGRIVYAGNLASYQGIELLIEAFGVVLKHRPKAMLTVLTDSPTERLQKTARASGFEASLDIRAVRVEDQHGELRRAHLAVNARPQCEGVSQKNLNYMAASLPLVAFSGSVHPYRPGESAFAVETVSGEALGGGILKMLDRPDEMARFGRNARATLEAEFTWIRQASRLIQVYERALNGSRPAARQLSRAPTR